MELRPSGLCRSMSILALVAAASRVLAADPQGIFTHHTSEWLPSVVEQTGYAANGKTQIGLCVYVNDNDETHFDRLMEDASHNLSWDQAGNEGPSVVHPNGGGNNFNFTTPALLTTPDGSAMAIISRYEGADNRNPYFQFYPFAGGIQPLDQNHHSAEYSYKLPEGDGQDDFGRNSFAAANLPDGTGFITVRYSFDTTLYVNYWRWEDFPNLDNIAQNAFPNDPYGTPVRPYYSTTLTTPAGTSRNQINGNVAMAITTNYDRMARWYPYRLTIAVSPGNGQAPQVREWRMNNKMPLTMLSHYFLTSPPRDGAWHAVGTRSDGLISMHTAPDGTVYLAALNRPSTSNDGTVELRKRSGYDYTTQTPTWSGPANLSGTTTHRCVPEYFYRTEDWASPQYNATTQTFPASGQINIPIKQLAVFNYDADYSGMGGSTGDNSNLTSCDYTSALQTDFAWARRRPLDETAQNTAGNVVGFFEGPPPLPNENIPLGDAVYYEQAQVNYGTNNTASSDFTSSLTAGVSAEFKVGVGFDYAGFGAKVELGFNLEQTWGKATANTTGTAHEGVMSENSFLASDGNGGTIVNPQGTLFIQKQTFTGFAYEMLPPGSDPNNASSTAMDGSRIFYTRIPTGEYVKAVDYWINPNAVQPGVLDSYNLSPTERTQLNAMAIKLGDGTLSSIPFSWTKQSQAKSSFTSWAENTDSHSSSLDVGVSVGVTLNTPVVDVEASVSTDVTTERDWSTTENDGYGLQIFNFYVPVNPAVVGTYSGYSFSTYLLADSDVFTKELLSQDPNSTGLVTQTWPTDPKMRSDNEIARSQILGSSRPWKVTYALIDETKITSLARLPAGVSLDAGLRAKLARLGITNTGQLDLVLRRLAPQFDGSRDIPSSRNVVVLYDLAARAAQQKQDAELDAAMASAFPAPAQRQRILEGITPAEAVVLRRLLSEVSSANIQAYTASHPRVYPRVPPPSVMNAPSYHSPYEPMFTATPPVGM